MKLIADTHTHTIASNHAYSTVLENIEAAKERGLLYLAMTEHGPNMPDAPHIWHCLNQWEVPSVYRGVHILHGVEANILDADGSLDIDSRILRSLEWVIASMHGPCFAPQSREQHTKAWLKIAQNPDVDVIGHCGRGNYEFDCLPVLKAFKEKDPNGNGLADEIPFIGATSGGENWFCDFIAAAFQPIDIQSNYLYPENGKIKAAYVEPEYKEALKYLNKLCTEGLLSPSSFTSDGEQTRQTIQNPSGVQVGCFTSMAPTYLINATDRAEGYDILAPLTQDNGTGYAVYGASIPTNSFFITKNCQYPEAAFRLGDIMMSEEMSIWNRFGKKGTDWVEPEEGDHGMFESMGYKAKIKPILAWGSPQNSHWQQGAPAYRGYELACATVDSGSNIYETRIAEHLQSYLDKKPKEYITKIIYTEDEINAINEIQQNITSYRKDSVARFIIGDWDIESGWEDYLKEMKAIGVDEMLDIVQKAYDRCNK